MIPCHHQAAAAIAKASDRRAFLFIKAIAGVDGEQPEFVKIAFCRSLPGSDRTNPVAQRDRAP